MISVDVIRKSQLNAPAKFATLQRRFLAKAGQLVQDAAKANAPVNLGDLKGSITSRRDGERSIVSSNKEHAPWVEYGTAPHFPPVDAIQEWAQEAIGDGSRETAFLIARHISKHGTKAQPFLRPALDNNKANLKRLFATMYRQVFSGK